MTGQARPIIYALRSGGGEDIHALRAILKALLRHYRWRCVGIRCESNSNQKETNNTDAGDGRGAPA